RSMRSKEVANDYRYFPEPDLLPIVIDEAYIDAIRVQLPELPDAKRARFVSQYGLSEYDAGVLASSRAMADFYEEVAGICGDAKLSANWVSGDLQGLLNKSDLDITRSPINATRLGGLIARIKDQTISSKIAKTVFESMIDNQGLKQVIDRGAIEKQVKKVITINPYKVDHYRARKVNVFAFCIDQAIKATRDRDNPKKLNPLLKERLKG